MDSTAVTESPRPSATRSRRWRRWALSGVAVVVMAVLGAALLRSTVADLYLIPSGSMEPTLQEGDRVAVDREAYRGAPVQRGQIVVFDGEGSLTQYQSRTSVERAFQGAAQWLGLAPDPSAYVKRVIGVGGDSVRCCTDEGLLEVNGEPLAEPYLAESASTDAPASQVPFTVEVPEGRVFLLGDHRAASVDSRALLGAPGGGMIPLGKVEGQVTQIVWPAERRGPAGTVEGRASDGPVQGDGGEDR